LITQKIFSEEYRSWSSLLCILLHSPTNMSLLGPVSSEPYTQTRIASVPPSMWQTRFHTHRNAQLYICISNIYILGYQTVRRMITNISWHLPALNLLMNRVLIC
jgi:hypothetical protein